MSGGESLPGGDRVMLSIITGCILWQHRKFVLDVNLAVTTSVRASTFQFGARDGEC